MPSISQKELNSQKDLIRAQQEAIGNARDRERIADARATAQAEILRKVVRAAQGDAILYHAPATNRGWGVAIDPDYRYDQRTGADLTPPPLDPLERAEQRIDALHRELGRAEHRLATVIAVAEMAQEHRA